MESVETPDGTFDLPVWLPAGGRYQAKHDEEGLKRHLPTRHGATPVSRAPAR